MPWRPAIAAPSVLVRGVAPLSPSPPLPLSHPFRSGPLRVVTAQLVTNRLQQGPTLALIQRTGSAGMGCLPEEAGAESESCLPSVCECHDSGAAAAPAAPEASARSTEAEPSGAWGAAANEMGPPEAHQGGSFNRGASSAKPLGALPGPLLAGGGVMRKVNYGGSMRKMSPTKAAGSVSPALGAITALLNDRSAEQAAATGTLARARSAEFEAMRDEVKLSLEQTREEMSARMDELATSIGAVHATLHDLIGKLPAKVP